MAFEIAMAFEAHYQREGTTGWGLKNWESANKLLGYQNADGPSFTIFTIDNGSYVQCAGGKRRLTVECRVFASNGKFRHFRFGKGDAVDSAAVIECACGPIRVSESEVLTMRDARLIIRHFVESGGGLHSGYRTSDITAEFKKPWWKFW